METLYDILGARPDDDADSLKDAYRKAAKANHPDRHTSDPEAAERFRRIVAAYDILRDAERRAAYDRLLESQRELPRLQARRATSHPASQFAFKAIAGVVVGIAVAGAGYLIRIQGITGYDGGDMTAGQPPQVVAVEPAKRADAGTEAPSHGPAREPRMPVVIMQGAAASAAESKSAWEAAQGPTAPEAAGRTTGHFVHLTDPAGPKAAGDPARDHRAEPSEQPQSTEPKTTAMSQDGICKRDAAHLAHLRISQERDEVVRFERELGCEKLRPQVLRLRESVDPQ
jgi:curved DNA-binding protein CbpA